MTLDSLRALLPEAALSVAALLAILASAVLGGRRAAKMLPAGIAIAGLLVAAGLSFLRPEAAPPSIVAADGLARFLKTLFVVVGLLSVLVSIQFLEEERASRGEYFGLLLLAIVGMMITAAARDVVLLFLGLELLSIATYVLVGFLKESAASTESAIKYFLLSSFATALFLYGLSLVYGMSGATAYSGIAASSAALGRDLGLVAVLAIVFLMAGIGFKATFVPFHMYAPDVYLGAPGSVVAFLAVGPKLAAFAALLRFLTEAMPAHAAQWVPLLTVVSILTMTIGNLVALLQGSLKRMLAYSSIAHAGYLLIGVVAAFTPAASPEVRSKALAAVLYYLVAYAFMKMGAFALLLSIKPGDRYAETLEDLKGLGRRRPATAALLLVFLLSLTGIPLTAGFTAKVYVFAAALSAGATTLAVAGVINAVIAAAYYLRAAIVMYAVEPGQEEPYAAGGLPLKVALASSALAILVFGVFPGLVLDTALQSVRSLF